MGLLSTQGIIDQGLEQAGDPSLVNPALIAFNSWLSSRAHERPRLGYPTLGSSFNPVPLGPGVASLILGGANSQIASLVTVNVIRVNDIWLALPGVRPPTNRLKIMDKQTGNLAGYNVGQAAAISPGLPMVANVIPLGPDANGLQSLQIWFDPIANVAYDMYLYVESDNRLAAVTYATTSFPWYPNDEVMVKFVELWAVRHQAAGSDRPIDEQRVRRVEAEYYRLMAEDRALLISNPDDDVIHLDDRFFGGFDTQLYNPGITRR